MNRLLGFLTRTSVCELCGYLPAIGFENCTECRNRVLRFSANMVLNDQHQPVLRVAAAAVAASVLVMNYQGLDFSVLPFSQAASAAAAVETSQFSTVETPAGREVQSECPICLEIFQPTDLVVKPRCHHLYHSNCLAGWTQGTCPLCREPIAPS